MNDIEGKNEEVPKPNRILGFRHFQFFLLFLSAIIGYGMRTNLSVGIVAMTAKNKYNKDTPYYPEFSDYKQTLLSSFFWGYICLQIGAGQIAKKYGPKWFLGGAMLFTSLFSILIPIFADKFGYAGVIICRVGQGLSQGFLFPSYHHLITMWAPHSEKSKIVSFVYTGGPLGNVISMALTGVIADTSGGWPSVFYLYGGLGIIWVIFWFLFGANSPSEGKCISVEERTYIESNTISDDSKKIPTPWLAIATSLPMSAILVSHAGQNWGFWTLLTEIPTYMNKILGFELTENAGISSLPYLALWLMNFVMSPLADYLITRKILTTGATRKTFNSIGLFVPALALVALSFVGKDQQNLAIGLLIVAVGINSATYCGFNVNHIDISPNHAGTLMGITNSLSNIFSIVAPLAIDGIRKVSGYEEEDVALWSIVFNLAAGIYVAVGVYFIIFASGEHQPWNEESYGKNEENETKEEKEKV